MAVSDSKFDVAGYEAFRARAQDAGLSRAEKVGFPDAYREGMSGAILADIRTKLTALGRPGTRVLDIGPGCSDLPVAIAELCAETEGRLVWVDSHEMLSHLPDGPHITKLAGPFPACIDAVRAAAAGFDAILVYSVAQYVHAEADLTAFAAAAAGLLAPRGRMLIGDIPNASRRKRFLASEAGRAYHRAHFDPDGEPEVDFDRADPGEIDDEVVLGLTAHLRQARFDAWIVPQAEDLPMANRREDILVERP